MNKWILVLALASVLVSCRKQSDVDRKKMDDYISKNHFTGSYTPEGVFVVIDVEGQNGHPTVNNTVKVAYTGTLLDGSVFDATAAGTFIEFPLTQVISGWQIGIPKFQKGGKGKLIIPSALGYGSNNVGSIPSNSVLVFDINLADWK